MFSNPLPSYIILAVEYIEFAIPKAIEVVSFTEKADRNKCLEEKEAKKEDNVQEAKEKA